MLKFAIMLLVYALLLVAQTCFKSYATVLSGEFDKEKLKQGIIKHAIILGAVLCIFVAGYIYELYVDAGSTITSTLIGLYSALILDTSTSVYQNLKELKNVNPDDKYEG